MNQIVIVTEKGAIIKFNATDLPTQLKGGVGVSGIKVRQGDKVVSMVVVEA